MAKTYQEVPPYQYGDLPHIVVTGNPVDGFEFFGPFIGAVTAVEAADDAKTSDSGAWHVAPLQSMVRAAPVEKAEQMREVLEWWRAETSGRMVFSSALIEEMSAKVNAVLGDG